MPKLSPTNLEKLRWSAQSWTEIMSDNMRLLNDTLLKVESMFDVDLTALADGDVLQWFDSAGEFRNVPYEDVFPTTTSTTTSTVTTSTVPGPTTSTQTTTSTVTVTTSTTFTVAPQYGAFNSSDKGTGIQLNKDNVEAEQTATSDYSGVSALPYAHKSQGAKKFYCEFEVVDLVVGGRATIGVVNPSWNNENYVGGDANGWSYLSLNGNFFNSGSAGSNGDAYTDGDIISVAVDLTNLATGGGKIWFGKNNVWQDSGNPAAGTNEAYSNLSGDIIKPAVALWTDGDKVLLLADSSDWNYTPPSGFIEFPTIDIWPTSTSTSTTVTTSTVTTTTLPYEQILGAFTEVDGGSDITLYEYSAHFDTMQRNRVSYVYKDYGVDYFEDFIIEWEARVTGTSGNFALTMFFALANTVGTFEDIKAANSGVTIAISRNDAEALEMGISLQDRVVDNSDTQYFSDSPSTPMWYFRFKRQGTNMYLDVFSDAARTTLLGTLQITCSTNAYRYLHILGSRDSSTSGTVTMSGISQYISIVDEDAVTSTTVTTTTTSTVTTSTTEDPYEDFTTWDETDPNGRFVVTKHNVEYVAMPRTDQAYVQKDYGPAYFKDFVFRVRYNPDSLGVPSRAGVLSLSNIGGTMLEMQNADDGVQLFLWRDANNRCYILDNDSGNSDYDIISTGTRWVEFERSGTTLTAKIYTDDQFTALQDTLTITCSGKAYRYLGVANAGYASGGNYDGHVSQLEIISFSSGTTTTTVTTTTVTESTTSTTYGPEAHTYWRIWVTDNLASNYIEIAKFELREGVGESDQAAGHGGTATANATWSASFPPEDAFDGDSGTFWIGDEPEAPGWLKYEFNYPVEVGEIFLLPRSGYQAYMPVDFKLQYSDDDINWYNWGDFSGFSASDWIGGQTFAVPVSTTTSTVTTTTVTQTTSTTEYPYLDLTTFTEVDEDGDLTITVPKVEISSLRRDAVTYVYKDFGAGYFKRDFQIDFKVSIDSADAAANFAPVILTNTPGTSGDQVTSGDGFRGIILMSGGNLTLQIADEFNSSYGTPVSLGVSSFGTKYARFERNGTDLDFTLYNEESRTTVFGTIGLTNVATDNLRYLEVTASRDSGSNPSDSITGRTFDWDIVENNATTTTTVTTSTVTQTTSTTVTVAPCSGTTIFGPNTMDGTLGSVGSIVTVRDKIDASELSGGASKIQILFDGGSEGWEFSKCYVGHASGVNQDFDGDQQQVLFGGAAGLTLGAGEQIWSDEITIDIDSNIDLFISYYNGSGSAQEYASTSGQHADSDVWWATTDKAGDTNYSGTILTQDKTSIVAEICATADATTSTTVTQTTTSTTVTQTTVTTSTTKDPLVLYIQSDTTEGSTTFVDSSPSNHTINANGGVQHTTARAWVGNSSIVFDGSGDFLDIDTSDDFDFGTGDFTISLKVWADTLASDDGFFALRQSTSTLLTARFGGGYAGMRFRVNGGTYDVAAVTTGWHEVDIVRDGNTLTIYVDHDDKHAIDVTGVSFDDNDLGIWIGAYYSSSYPLDGNMDEIKIYKGLAVPPDPAFTTTTSTTTVTESTTSTTGPPSNWAFNPSDAAAALAFYEGNERVKHEGGGTSFAGVRSVNSFVNGKIYYEFEIINKTNNNFCIGFADGTHPLTGQHVGDTDTDVGVGFHTNARLYHDGEYISYGSSCGTGDVVMVALDSETGRIWFGKNGTWFESGNPATGANPGFVELELISLTKYIMVTLYDNNDHDGRIKIRNSDFDYTVPSGFYSPEGLADAPTTTTTTNPPGGWLSDWENRIELNVHPASIDAELTHFPIPLIISNSSGLTNTDLTAIFDNLESDANRKKIAVTKGDGVTQLYVEIESWSDADEKAVLWVSKSDLVISPNQPTKLYLYFDKGNADNTTYVGDTGDTPAQNVWDSNFELVYHMAGSYDSTPDEVKDSTSHGVDGEAGRWGEGVPTQVDGIVGKEQDFDTDSIITDMLPYDPEGETEITVEALAKHDTGVSSYSHVITFAQSQTSGNMGLALQIDTSNFRMYIHSSGSETVVYSKSDAERRHLAGVLNGSDQYLFIDGIEVAHNDTVPGAISSRAGSDLSIGIRNDAYPRGWAGTIDEVRISSTPRSAAWLRATKHSLFDDMIEYGPQDATTTSTVTTSTTVTQSTTTTV